MVGVVAGPRCFPSGGPDRVHPVDCQLLQVSQVELRVVLPVELLGESPVYPTSVLCVYTNSNSPFATGVNRTSSTSRRRLLRICIRRIHETAWRYSLYLLRIVVFYFPSVLFVVFFISVANYSYLYLAV